MELIQTIIQGLGLLSLIGFLYQLKKTNDWNKISFTVQLKWREDFNKYYSQLINYELELENKLLSDKEFNYIINNPDALKSIQKYLDYFEELSCCINNNGMHDKMVYSSFSVDFLFCYCKFKKIIENLKERDDDSFYYCEIEKLYKKWNKKLNKENKFIQKKI
jgi:hypothetical protein